MISLYKLIDGFLHYWQYRENEDSVSVHHGLVGDEGELLELTADLFPDYVAMAEEIKRDKLAEGYESMAFDKNLVITFLMDDDLDPFEEGVPSAPEIWLDELLIGRGLGKANQTALQGETIIVSASVMDAMTAKEVVLRQLEQSDFSNYLTIELHDIGI